MSYILDALRKADQQRQHGTVPTLQTSPTVAAAPAKTIFSFNGWIVFSLVIAAGVVGWLRPLQMDSSSPTEKSASSKPYDPRRDQAESSLPSGLDSSPLSAVPPTPSQMAAKIDEPSESPPISPAATKAMPIPPESLIGAPPPVTSPAHDKQIVSSQTETGQVQRVMSMSELPSSVRQGVPKLSISFHAYSDKPVDRRVILNNELLRQGELLKSGLIVEQIIPDGVILGHKGYRFHLGLRQ